MTKKTPEAVVVPRAEPLARPLVALLTARRNRASPAILRIEPGRLAPPWRPGPHIQVSRWPYADGQYSCDPSRYAPLPGPNGVSASSGQSKDGRTGVQSCTVRSLRAGTDVLGTRTGRNCRKGESGRGRSDHMMVHVRFAPKGTNQQSLHPQ